MLQCSGFKPTFFVPSDHLQNAESLNVITVSPNFSDINSNSENLSSATPKPNSSGTRFNKDIYVCTFCQVFSPSLTDVAEHIASLHLQSIPPGRNPENFVSKLQALNKNIVKEKGKVGRPRKSQEKRPKPQESKKPLEDPIPGPDGLFWCKNCLHNFRKPRQLIRHICIESEDIESSSDGSFIESDDDEFKTYMDIDPVPWSRKIVYGTAEKNLSNDVLEDALKAGDILNYIESDDIKDVPYWRNDPSYVPLFCDNKDKLAFEEHLKSIDYSFVDGFYHRKEKHCRSNKKKNSHHVQRFEYTCNLCKKVFKSQSHIRIHCLTHTDLKPFTCPKCDYSSNSKGSLYAHMRKHTGNVFSCSSCDFKTAKRAHLLDHEATHSSIPQICKLCKNSYKTLRSLIAHIKRYHDYPGGKKYIKFLTTKQDKTVKCEICNKKFKSAEILTKHDHVCHISNFICDINEAHLDDLQIEQNLEEIGNSLQLQDPSSFEQPMEHTACNMQSKDPLADIVLNDLLQQDQSHSIMYENDFSTLCENMLPSSFLPKVVLEDFFAKAISSLPPDESILEECEKPLDLNLLCLQNTDFSSHQNFSLQSSMANAHSLQNISINNSDIDSHLQDLSVIKCEEPVEVKLFEKCKRAPAYVCCVCSAIYICPSTLKAHLKEHVNSSNDTLIEPPDKHFENSGIPENSDLDNVCEILQDSADSCSFDKELEKLYTSSLDKIWYLPGVSVVVDTKIPSADNYNASQYLDVKGEEESVLNCFDEI